MGRLMNPLMAGFYLCLLPPSMNCFCLVEDTVKEKGAGIGLHPVLGSSKHPLKQNSVFHLLMEDTKNILHKNSILHPSLML